MTITTGSGEVKNRWIRLNGEMVTEKEYNAYMNKEKTLAKKKRAEERKALAKAKAQSKAKTKKLSKLAKSKSKAKTKATPKVKTSKPTVRVEIGPTNVGSLFNTPKARSKVKAKTPTAKKRVAKPKSQGVQTEKYYIVADVNGTGRNMRFFDVARGRAVDSPNRATYGLSLEEANDIIMTARTVYPGVRFSVKKRRA